MSPFMLLSESFISRPPACESAPWPEGPLVEPSPMAWLFEPSPEAESARVRSRSACVTSHERSEVGGAALDDMIAARRRGASAGACARPRREKDAPFECAGVGGSAGTSGGRERESEPLVLVVVPSPPPRMTPVRAASSPRFFLGAIFLASSIA